MKHEWSVRVRTESTWGLRAVARNHAWPVGTPITFAAKDDQPSALELAVGALGADLLGGLQRLSRLERIEIERAEISLRWSLDNPLTYIGVVGEDGEPSIDAIEGVVYVASFEPDRVRSAWGRVLVRSPLYNTLSKAADIRLRLELTP